MKDNEALDKFGENIKLNLIFCNYPLITHLITCAPSIFPSCPLNYPQIVRGATHPVPSGKIFSVYIFRSVSAI